MILIFKGAKIVIFLKAMEKIDKSSNKTCKTIACLWEARQPAASLRRHGCGAAAKKL